MIYSSKPVTGGITTSGTSAGHQKKAGGRIWFLSLVEGISVYEAAQGMETAGINAMDLYTSGRFWFSFLLMGVSV
jgi:hypothetical protein